MRKLVSTLLLSMALVLASSCGSSSAADQAGKADQAAQSQDANQAAQGADQAQDANQAQDADQAQDEAGDVSQADASMDEADTESAVMADQAMLEMANTNMQTDHDQMAFDEEYIYFTDGYDDYRCRYDGSAMEKLAKDLDDVIMTDGKLMGFAGLTGDATDGLFSMDPATGEVTQEFETSGNRITSILVSGNWMCYAGEGGNALVIRDMTTGEEKTIAHSEAVGSGVSDIAMCLYGNTLYALIDDGASMENCRLCTYELGSGADSMTELCRGLTVSQFVGPTWMADGLLLLDWTREEGWHFYHAKFADIDADGKWDYQQDENRVGSATILEDDSLLDAYYSLDDATNARYVVEGGLVIIKSSTVEFYADFDLAAKQVLAEGDDGWRGTKRCHGMHDGCVYLFRTQTSSTKPEILKIAGDGSVEHIPVVMPE